MAEKKKFRDDHYHTPGRLTVVAGAIYIVGGLGVRYLDWDVELFFIGLGVLGVLIGLVHIGSEQG